MSNRSDLQSFGDQNSDWMTVRFQRRYLQIALVLFIIELIIALFLHDRFIRAYGGDFLVVIFLYCLIKSFLNYSPLRVAIAVLAFAFTVEFSQALHLISLLHLDHYRLAILILGKSFQWLDLVAYTLGILLVLFIEARNERQNHFR